MQKKQNLTLSIQRAQYQICDITTLPTNVKDKESQAKNEQVTLFRNCFAKSMMLHLFAILKIEHNQFIYEQLSYYS